MFQIILSTVRFLARQGHSFTCNNSDAESNLLQLLKLRTEDCSQLRMYIVKGKGYNVHLKMRWELCIACTVQRKMRKLVR